MFLTRFSSDLSTSASNLSLTICSHGNRSTVDQVTLLTQSIENAFEAKKKAGAVFIDLAAAYDTVWHRGLTCKLLRLLPDKHMVRMIMELVHNWSFTLTNGDSKPSRLRRLRNGVPQGSVLAPSLFNIYTYDVPSITSKKFAYADDVAILHTSGDWKEMERTLSQDMTTLSEYLQIWRLKLSHTKKGRRRPFTSTIKRPSVSLKSVTSVDLTFLLSSHLSWGQTGQIAHISSSPGSIAQEAMCSRLTIEETCGKRLEC